VNDASTLSVFETIVDGSGVAARLEALLPLGVRPRQLRVRTLILGILLALADGRPAHLTRAHAALVALGDDERRRLGVVVEWKGGSHLLTYRQTEYTMRLIEGVLRKETPDGEPSDVLQELADDLSEAPATPKALFTLEPLARGASEEETAAHDGRSAELARYKLGRISADDADGFHRVACPAIAGKVRCPRRAESMALSAERPEIAP
jgi:hypothetical protein